jgi:CheY-like chemotaxis protein
MTTGKRALIVDDSRSARVILSRMLEQHGMSVDTAESAEQALEYLRQHRPDVIFMDHLMPGMDGFQAVQAIKGDPQTATIPLMMYTSQEGELYVSQARALGAVGVLPKTVRPVDVSRVLYQLHLLPDRRQPRSALFDGSRQSAMAGASAAHAAALAGGTDAAAAAAAAAGGETVGTGTTGSWAVPLSELQGSLRESLQQAMRDQFADQRRFLLATFEAFARRMSGEFREAGEKAPPPPVLEPAPPPPPPRTPWWPVALTALLAAVPAAILGYLTWQAAGRNEALARELAESRSALSVANQAAAAARLAESAARAAAAAVPPPGAAPAAGVADGAPAAAPVAVPAAVPADAPLAVEYVPYGEIPLSGERLERLRELAATLESQQFRGRVVVETHTGDFCLSGGVSEGFEPTGPARPSVECDVIGNPFDDSLTAARHQSVDFANFVATLRQRSSGAIEVQIVNADRRHAIPYPKPRAGSTAGDWNAVAVQNNRVEFRAVPAG